MTSTPMVSVKGLGKRFKLYEKPHHRLSEWLSFGKRVLHKDFWALSDISFEVNRGECFGIIGENGAGKSTILKILTGALSPTHGEVKIRGRSLSILELGAGFNGELTGRKNVENNAVLLGFPAGYVTQERMRAIESFADIGEFFDRPVKMYSSGMHVRLAFSMFMMMEPEVFIIDEALSVGDIFFSQKCFARIREMMAAGVTFIFVSHDLPAVQNLSTKVLMLRHGQAVFAGSPSVAVGHYMADFNKGPTTVKSVASGGNAPVETGERASSLMDPAEIIAHSILHGKHRVGSGGMEIIAARVTDAAGMDTLSFQMMEEAWFYIYARVEMEIAIPSFGIGLYDKMDNMLFLSTSKHLGVHIPQLRAGDSIVTLLKLKMTVQPAQYTFSLNAGNHSPEKGANRGELCDQRLSLGPLSVTFDYSRRMAPFYGIAQMPLEAVFDIFPYVSDGREGS